MNKKKITSSFGAIFIVPIDHPSQPEWGVGYTEEIIVDNEVALSDLWQAANTFAESQFDSNSRASMLWIAMNPATSQDKQEKILDIQTWWAGLWSHYAEQKAKVIAGVTYKFDTQVVGNCPWNIWDIT